MNRQTLNECKSLYPKPEEILAGGDAIERTKSLLEKIPHPEIVVNFICRQLSSYIVDMYDKNKCFVPSEEQVKNFQDFMIQDFVCLETLDMTARPIAKLRLASCHHWLMGNKIFRDRILDFVGLKDVLIDISGVDWQFKKETWGWVEYA